MLEKVWTRVKPPICRKLAWYGRFALAAHNELSGRRDDGLVLVLVSSGCPLAVPGKGDEAKSAGRRRPMPPGERGFLGTPQNADRLLMVLAGPPPGQHLTACGLGPQR